MKPREENHSTT